MMASFSGHCDVVRVLIEANANVQKRTKRVCALASHSTGM